MNYHGINVHKDESYIAGLDEDSEVDREIRVFDANLDEVAEEYEGSQAAVEATARKQLVAISHMLQRKEVYDPSEVSS